MKIEFPAQGLNQTKDKLNMALSHETSARIADETFGYSLDISSKDKDITAFGKGELDSLEDLAQKASVKNVALESKANAVMSNSLSEEDFAEYQKEGYSPSNMNIDDVVTNLDKIKATLLESGVVIEGYTDNISDATLNKITGNQAITNMIKDTFAKESIPVTSESATEVTELISIASELSDPTEDAKKYMIVNNMTPTVQNFYMANFSAGSDTGRHAAFYIDNTGYATAKPQETDWQTLKPQAEKLIESAGFEVNENTLSEAKWLVEKDIPLTKENLSNLEKVNSVVFPINAEDIVTSSAVAIVDRVPIKNADLTENKSFVRKAVELKDEVLSYIDSIPKENIKDTRVLEETRLHMTLEANLHLLKKGITVDTKNLEKLVEDLKEAEKEIYKPLITTDEEKETISDNELIGRIDLYRETRAVVEAVKFSPVEAIADVITNKDSFTLASVGKAGTELKTKYEKAGKAYETLMTAPRADMGDSIKKAFRNVDDILEDIGLKINSINEKAVRSLGYAGVEISKDNIEEVSRANTNVEKVISLMTPAKTLSMIREGINPLDTDIYELGEVLKSDEEVSNEKYSEFLWKLEKSGEITDNEKAAFIGMYRLFRQIEKSDGRLVGDVVKAGDKLTLNNLLMASRNDRAQGLDIKIDETFGALEKLVTYGESITDQILQGFRGDKAFDKQYLKEETDQLREAAKLEESVMNALQNADEPVTANNILAMDQLMNYRGTAFEKLMKKAEGDSEKSRKLKDAVRKLQADFSDKENADAAVEDMVETASDFSSEVMQNAENSIDLKEMSLVHKQLSIVKELSKNSQYEVPVEINGQWTSINLKLIKDDNETGKVSISFEMNNTGKVSADFKISDNRVSGFVISEKVSGNEFMKQKTDALKGAINPLNLELDTIYYSQKADININGAYTSESTDNIVKTADIYNFAKAFIAVMQTA